MELRTFLIMLSGFVFFLAMSGSISANTWTVCSSGCNFITIQGAVDAASDGDTILVGAGTYTENVKVNKSINLIGDGADVTIVNASNPDDHVFEVTADWVNLTGFTLMGANIIIEESEFSYEVPGVAGAYLNNANFNNISYCDFTSNNIGIFILNSSKSSVKRNDLHSIRSKGIFLKNTSYIKIVSNTVKDSSMGIESILDRDNFIESNHISNITLLGFNIHPSNNLTFSNNTILHSLLGFGIYFSNNNTLINNSIFETFLSIDLEDSNGNKIYNNLFNSTDSVYIRNVSSTNHWNITKQAGTNIVGGPYLGGNFWANPNGTGFSETCMDADSDGICNSYYNLTSGNVDYLPLAVYTALPTINATIDIDPDTLNLNSRGRWITAYIELPEGYNVSDINVSTILLNDAISAELSPMEIGDYDNDGVPDIMVKFDRANVEELIHVPTEIVELTLTGTVSGIPFEGGDTIKVIKKGK